jgi:DNA polymerase III sliding clamp (beta) subunit (PCNA family)
MILDRLKFFQAAELAKPALSEKEMVEECLCFWLDGKSLTAFDDASLGIQVPFVGELKGGIRGSVLLGFLEHGSAAELEVTIEEKDQALLKIGRSRLRLSLMPSGRAIWQLPALDKEKPYRLPAEVLEALKAVRISLGPGTAKLEQLGVTIMPAQGGLQFYASDEKTVAWASCKKAGNWPLKDRVIMPTAFVEQLIRLADEKTDLWISDREVMAKREDGLILFARMIHAGSKVTDFKAVIDRELKDVQMFDIPERLKAGLERVAIVSGDEVVAMWFQGNTLRIHATAKFGELKDIIEIDAHPKELEFKLNPELMKRALDLCKTMGASERATIMAGDNFLYMIQNRV